MEEKPPLTIEHWGRDSVGGASQAVLLSGMAPRPVQQSRVFSYALVQFCEASAEWPILFAILMDGFTHLEAKAAQVRTSGFI